jgi:hypothetical protein
MSADVGIYDLTETINPGDKYILWDDRQYGHNSTLQLIWVQNLQQALIFLGIGDQWLIRRTHLESGDVVVVVGLPPDKEGKPQMAIVAIGEIKNTVEDFVSSCKKAKSGERRLFGSSNEIERISQAGAIDNQYFLAYPAWLPDAHWGVLDSLRRDYGVYTWAFLDEVALAMRVAKFAKRYNHKISSKGVIPKKNIPLDLYQRSWIGFVTTEKIAEKLLAKLKTPQAIFKVLENCQFTKKAHKIICPPEFADCGFAERGSAPLQWFYDCYMIEMKQSSQKPEKKIK